MDLVQLATALAWLHVEDNYPGLITDDVVQFARLLGSDLDIPDRVFALTAGSGDGIESTWPDHCASLGGEILAVGKFEWDMGDDNQGAQFCWLVRSADGRAGFGFYDFCRSRLRAARRAAKKK
ncbi:MAG: hypothetical protein IPM79_31520 [Polyangiaceae bacterium]|nr:hypothetical protein [Polyangiaceae bacterium]